ncbi:cobalamin-independent methionine synthase II family protein [Georgenia sp. Z1491]|uniref:cobalamin-independent methionine synthase II family protein n=1 Tax=Georgenia sp. Z1491 TaxID=3416707 RepID=UPI003CE8D09E
MSKVRTTHAGSLPRTAALIDANAARAEDRIGQAELTALLESEVAGVVARQTEAGLDHVNDGEYGKLMSESVDYGAWWSYSFGRTGGLTIDPDDQSWAADSYVSSPGDVRLTGFLHRRDRALFADAYADPTSGIWSGGDKPRPFPVVTGELTYTGADAVRADVDHLVAALAAAGKEPSAGFVTALSPGSATRITDRFYGDEDAYLDAWARVLREEYKAILDAGLWLQIDDPSVAENFDQITPEPAVADYVAFTEKRVAALNRALEGLPTERVRFHLCWGSWHGPHSTDLPLADIAPTMLTVNAAAYSFEAANVRHEHEWRVWENLALPADKVLVPGVVSHATNVLEHPELVADRIERFARLVGPERVWASTDCGLGGRVHEQIAWAKLDSLVEGARIADRRLAGGAAA